MAKSTALADVYKSSRNFNSLHQLRQRLGSSQLRQCQGSAIIVRFKVELVIQSIELFAYILFGTMTQSCCAIAKILSTVFLLLSSSFACEDQYNDSSEGRQNIESILLNDIYKINNPWLSRYYYGYYRQPSAQISSGIIIYILLI